MPDADTNKPSSEGGAPPVANQKTTAASQGSGLFVDGKEVSESEYFKAAAPTYDVEFLRSHPNVRPSINTSKEVK